MKKYLLLLLLATNGCFAMMSNQATILTNEVTQISKKLDTLTNELDAMIDILKEQANNQKLILLMQATSHLSEFKPKNVKDIRLSLLQQIYRTYYPELQKLHNVQIKQSKEPNKQD